VIRAVTLVAGLAAAAYGGLQLADRGWENFRAAATWLVAGVVLHDALLAPVTIAVAWVALRVLGSERLAPWAVGLVLLGPLTLLAVPVLGRYGARPDNSTLLDRPYWAGWIAVVVAVVVGILVVRYAERRRSGDVPVAPSPQVEGGVDGSRHGGR
jgi:hypothetical protein